MHELEAAASAENVDQGVVDELLAEVLLQQQAAEMEASTGGKGYGDRRAAIRAQRMAEFEERRAAIRRAKVEFDERRAANPGGQASGSHGEAALTRGMQGFGLRLRERWFLMCDFCVFVSSRHLYVFAFWFVCIDTCCDA